MIPLAGTLVRCVPPARPKSLAISSEQTAQRNLLQVRRRQFAKAFEMGDFNAAASLAEHGYNDALAAREPQIAALFLGNLGSCRFAVHQYREALQAYTQARKLAEDSGDNAATAKLDVNISSLYSYLHQMDAAIESARRAVARLSGGDRARQLIQLAVLYAAQERTPEALALYRQGIDAAERADDPKITALGWEYLGYGYLEEAENLSLTEAMLRRKLAQAEPALLHAYLIRKLNHLRSIDGSYRNLGMLRRQQGDMPAASRLLDRAVELSCQPGGLHPAWDIYYARGRVRLAQHRLQDALDDLRIAARLARIWRRNALPDDATRVSTENLVQKVHSSLVEAGNKLYFQTGRRSLARETFESAEANRAASLRALLAEPRDWRRNLPAEYWETLQKLESAEVASLRTSASLSPGPSGPSSGPERIQQLQGALIQWESRAGSTTDVEMPDLLEHTRRSLRPDAAFFAFHLASPDSYLWAVSRENFALYRLPPGPDIAALVDRFIKGVRQGDAESRAAGARLFHTLFGQLDPKFQKKPRWLLALDAQLFDLPFAALIVETSRQGPVFLTERHSLQIVSGASMLMPPSRSPGNSFSGPFLGVAEIGRAHV